MDDNAPLRALLGAVDHVLIEQGVNPEIVTQDDKLLMAASYVEACGVQEKMGITTLPEDQIRVRLFGATS
jgi:hypothetical protein